MPVDAPGSREHCCIVSFLEISKHCPDIIVESLDLEGIAQEEGDAMLVGSDF